MGQNYDNSIILPLFKDKNHIYIISAFLFLTLFYLGAEYILTGHQWGVPLDDTWIHFRFAENFAKGHFFQYNIGDATPGTTSPLWVILMSIPFLFSSNLYLPFSYIAGSVFFLLCILEVYRLSLKLGYTKNYSLLITFLTLLCGRLLWSSLSGMEVTLACYLMVLITRIHLSEIENDKIKISTGLLLGLSVVTRPEAFLFAVIYYSVSIIFLRKNIKSNLETILYSFGIFLAVVIPYPIFCHAATGSFLPNTFKSQNGGLRFIPDFEYLTETGKLFFKDNLLILILWFVAIFNFIRTLIRKKVENKFLLIHLWIILLPVISAFIAPSWRHHGRYLIPLIPFINIAAIYIFAYRFNTLDLPTPKEARIYRIGIIVVMFVLSGINAFVFARALGWNTENINDQQVKIALWINANIPDEKCVGLNDIGAITFLTKKKIVDMEGLVTPEIFKINQLGTTEKDLQLLYLLKRNGVNYLIIYPEWYFSFIKSYGGFFDKILMVRLDNNTICGEAEMFVYRIQWDKLNLN